MLKISNTVNLLSKDIEMTAIRSQGAGGQQVNKLSSAIHLRFDVKASGLPDIYKQRLLQLNDQRMNKEGVIVIKAQTHRTQQKNKDEALFRLVELIKRGMAVAKKRHLTRPTKGSKKRRLDKKSQRGQVKKLRGKMKPSLD